MTMTPLLKPHPLEMAPPSLASWERSPTGVPYVHERDSGVPGPEVMVAALVHGNEYSGAIVVDELLRSGLAPRIGRITAAFCNMAAFERFDATQPDASRFIDEDLNRVWQVEQLDGPGRSVELTRARELRPFLERATHLLDLHSMHEPCEPLLLTGLLPRNIAFAQALRTGAQVIADAGHAEGARMRDYGAFNDPNGAGIALLLEAGQHWEEACLAAARDTLARFLLATGSVEREDVPAGWLQPDADPPAPVLVTHRVVAKSMDFAFTEDFRGGETISRAGTVIAHNAGDVVRTPYDDCVLVMPSLRQLRPGVTTVRLGRRASVRAHAAAPLT